MKWFKKLSLSLEAAFNRWFVRMAFKDYGVKGEGEIVRRDGTVTKFWVRGDVSEMVLTNTMKLAAIKLHGFLAGGPFRRMLGAVTHPTAMRTAIADLVVDAIDGGSGAGVLVFQTSGSTAVATLTFSDPAFGAASSGTATASAITSDTNAAGGTIAKAEVRTSAATAIFLCACGTSGSDINLSSLVVGASDTVSMSSLTYSAPN